MGLGGAVLLQSTVLWRALPAALVPDLALVLVVLGGVFWGWQQGLVAGSLAALLESLLSAAPAGALFVSLAGVGLAAGLVGSAAERTGGIMATGLVATATLGAFLLLVLGFQGAGWRVGWEGSTLTDLVFRAAVNAAASVPLTPVVRALAAPASGEVTP